MNEEERRIHKEEMGTTSDGEGGRVTRSEEESSTSDGDGGRMERQDPIN